MPVPNPLEFNAVNRVVLLSTLKSGQPPKKRPLAPKDSARVRAPGRDKVCPICGDCFTMDYRLEDHFVACARRNGNPQGHFWNDALDNGKRIPWESDPKYRRRCEYKVKLNAVSGVVFPSKLKRGQSPIKSPYGSTARNRDQNRDKTCAICGDCFTTAYRLKCHFIHCVGRNGNPQGYYWNGALDDKRRIGNEKDEEVSLSVGDVPHISEEQRTQTSSKTAQVVESLRYITW